MYEDNEESKFDLIEQVFDNGDILDIGERGEVLAEMTKSEYEKAKELDIDFLQVYIEKNPEEEDEKRQELQRRQEVVEVTNELFKRATMKDWYCDLIKHGKTKKTYLEWIFGWAENFVYTREKYLKEGKL